MRKTPEAERQLKLALRDIVARNPLVSVAALQRDLAERGFKTNQGNTVDWYYVAKVFRKLNRYPCRGWPLPRLAANEERNFSSVDRCPRGFIRTVIRIGFVTNLPLIPT
jgi:hypothetical protein